MRISSSVVRLAWTIVEEASPSNLLALSDTVLVKLLMQHVAQKILLNGEEVGALSDYLGLKVSLIRDIAESRLSEESRLLGGDLIPRSSGLLPALDPSEVWDYQYEQ
jgi:hypothetical protein